MALIENYLGQHLILQIGYVLLQLSIIKLEVRASKFLFHYQNLSIYWPECGVEELALETEIVNCLLLFEHA